MLFIPRLLAKLNIRFCLEKMSSNVLKRKNSTESHEKKGGEVTAPGWLLDFKHDPKKTQINNKTKVNLITANKEDGIVTLHEHEIDGHKSSDDSVMEVNYTKSDLNKETPAKIKGERRHVQLQVENKQSTLSVWKPKDWQTVVENLRTMRKDKDAPVDTMGCDKCVDETADPKVQRFHHLVSLMLSSQTKDQITFVAMQRLKCQPLGLTLDSIKSISVKELADIIHPVSFYKTKAKHIKATAVVLEEQYAGDIPDTAQGLCKLPGVGPKMAHICMQTAWGKTTGIGVDIHVHRISNRLGWVKRPTKTPEATRKALESWLPQELWSEVNSMLVGFGQTICEAKKPKCSGCLNKDLCPVGRGHKKP